MTAASLVQWSLLCIQDESVKGILTILCNHSFHVACLAEWKDTRYSQFASYCISAEVLDVCHGSEGLGLGVGLDDISLLCTL